MNQLPASVGSTQTSRSTVTASRPASRSLGSLMLLPPLFAPPEKVKPSPAFHVEAPCTVPARPLPEESAAVVPVVSSSFHQPTRSVVRSPSAPAAGEVATAAPPTAAASATARRARSWPGCAILCWSLLSSSRGGRRVGGGGGVPLIDRSWSPGAW